LTNLYGGGGKNKLHGPDADTLWTITGLNTGYLGTNVHFAQFQDLTGGAGNDRFALKDGQGLSGVIDGGGGLANVLDYGNYASPVLIDVGTHKATNVGSFAAVQQFVGGTAADTLVGTNTPNLWTINGH